jgi:protein-tyrosine phosphatase
MHEASLSLGVCSQRRRRGYEHVACAALAADVIDLHTHILPGVDDGPDEVEASVALARAAAAGGTHLMAATPHLRSDHPGVHVEEIRDRCLALEARLAQADVALRILPAAEVDVLWASEASDEALRLATYGQRGAYILLETPYGPLPPDFDDVLSRITLQGIRIMLAHPERNPTFQRTPQAVVDLVNRGVLVQITALSLVRESRRSRSRRVARWLVQQEAAHVIASDAHSAGTWRGPEMETAIAVAESIDPARAEWMVHEVPQAIVAGEPLPSAPLRSTDRGPLRGMRRRAMREARSDLGS